MLIIKAKIRAAPIGRATKKKSTHVFRCPVNPRLLFSACSLIFEFAVEKNRTLKTVRSFFFGLHLFLGNKLDSEDVKTFFFVFTDLEGIRANP